MTSETRPIQLERLRPARAHLRQADPVIREFVDAHRHFDPRAWLTDLPEMDGFGTLSVQIIGQQLSVRATRRLLARPQDKFAGRLPTPDEVLAADPQVLHASGLSRRKVETIRRMRSS